jgi:hypothetical protein
MDKGRATPGSDARRPAGELIRLHQDGRITELAEALAGLVNGEPPGARRLRTVIGDLVDTSARLLCDRFGPPREGELFTVSLSGEVGVHVRIDDLEPSVRAALRALLSVVNGDRGAGAYQIHLAVDGRPPAEHLRLLTHCLCWTTELLDARLDAGMPELHCLGRSAS